MAVIKAFRGIRYNPDRIDDLSTVVSQPYDRVRYGLQDEYYALSEYNITRIIKGKAFEGDNETNNVYTRARGFLDRWLSEGILVREEQPALYIYHQQFSLPDGETVTRKAFICAFELAEFDEEIVLPHERTLSGPKVDRLKLSRATETYFGNIFMLYPDPDNKVDSILAPATKNEPDIDIRELYEKDVRQMLWVVTDSDLIQAVVDEMAPKRNLIIADGHHRYETALNYRGDQRIKFPDAPPNAGFNYRLVTLVSMSNPGLTILPTHRLIFDYDKFSPQELLSRVGNDFDVEPVTDRADLEARLAAAHSRVGCIGLVTSEGLYLLTLKSRGTMESLAPDRSLAWRELDVSILHELLLENTLGLSKESIERKENINYLREPDMGYDLSLIHI